MSPDLKVRFDMAGQWLLARLQERSTAGGLGLLIATLIPRLSGAAEGVAVIIMILGGLAMIMFDEKLPPSP